jgi:hypothetical protein
LQALLGILLGGVSYAGYRALFGDDGLTPEQRAALSQLERLDAAAKDTTGKAWGTDAK